MNFRKKLSLIRDVLRSPTVEIQCYGGADSKAIFRYFHSRHPKLPLFRRKTFGAALRPVPLADADVDVGSQFGPMRRKVRKATKAGFTFRRFDPRGEVDSIMRINHSSMARQGGKMPADYLDRAVVTEEMRREGDWFGVFSADGRLEAYAFVPTFGDAFVFWKILGNADLLDEGIVYLLVDQILRVMAAQRRKTGRPAWAMYDMYIGGGDGLREFKRRTGFVPHRVRWRWVAVRPN